MLLIAETALVPESLLTWVVVGLMTGLLAGGATEGGYGVRGDLIAGLFGAVSGGVMFSLFVSSFWGSALFACLGACVCITLVRVRPARDHSHSPGR